MAVLVGIGLFRLEEVTDTASEAKFPLVKISFVTMYSDALIQQGILLRKALVKCVRRELLAGEVMVWTCQGGRRCHYQ